MTYMKLSKTLSETERLDPARKNAGARLLSALPLLVMAVYLYGPRPLVLCGVAVVVAVLCDVLAAAMRGRPWQKKDFSSPLFAVLLVCLCPASVPYHVLVVATLTGILVGKHLFGGFGSYPFHPTALGYVVAVVSWPTQMLSFPAPFTRVELTNTPAFVAVETPAATLQLGGLPSTGDVNLLLGNFAGPLAVTATIVVLACGLTMLAVRRFDLAAPLGFAATCVLLVRAYPRVSGVEMGPLLRAELLVCGLAFGVVFLLQDEITLPHRLLARVLYGALVGLLTIGYQYYSSCPYGICFGVLWGNALSGVLERWADAAWRWLGRVLGGWARRARPAHRARPRKRPAANRSQRSAKRPAGKGAKRPAQGPDDRPAEKPAEEGTKAPAKEGAETV